MHCLQCFYSEYHLENHKEECLLLNGTQKVEMPQPGTKVYFKNHQKQLTVPFVIDADFEAITKKVSTCTPPKGKSYNQAYQKHEASGFGYKVVCHYNQKYSKPAVIYQGDNVIEKFFEFLCREVKDCQEVISEKAKRRLVMTFEDEKDFKLPRNVGFVRKNTSQMKGKYTCSRPLSYDWKISWLCTQKMQFETAN